MLAIIFLTIFVALVLAIQLKLISKTKIRDESSSAGKNPSSKLKPVPYFSVFYVLIWSMTIGKRSLLPLLIYFGRRSKVIQCSLIGQKLLFINDLELGKEAFNRTSFAGRPHYGLMALTAQGNHGIIATRGSTWREQRKFTYQHLKGLGFNTKTMEMHIQEEIDELLQSWKDKEAQVFCPQKSFYIPLLSTIWVILVGERASTNNKQIVHLVNKVYSAVGHAAKIPFIIAMGYPFKEHILDRMVKFLRHVPLVKNYINHFDELHSYLAKEIKTKKELIGENESPSDLLEVYLKEMQQTTDSKSSFYGKQGEKNLQAVMVDFFIAGGDTTACMLAWCMLHLIRNPEVQNAIVKEIEVIVGTGASRRLQLSDRPNCPYTQSFILEALRYTPFSATSLPHVVTEDTHVGEYFVEKGTMVFLNNYCIHHNPEIWGDPQVFRPERFLSPDGKTCVKHAAICTFSMGWRRCPGEQLAQDNMFLFVSAICQRFILKQDPSLKGLPELIELKSLFNAPDIFNMVVEDRL